MSVKTGGGSIEVDETARTLFASTDTQILYNTCNPCKRETGSFSFVEVPEGGCEKSTGSFADLKIAAADSRLVLVAACDC